ncbi:glycosyltransferase family 2 protein [Novosphingobium mangrovi (ex Huang et al. 2023)]|uniref:Glycosyltransferase n=1 Tax=Novosphingobium mangrovi (ex Huang et al. 2023) TaxID=2976432 RepID=A0ABT2I0S0_9SPHN|nr:glycosyltransferase [Novosphingobium mangrovi (ex Huang et al. 2023)]MCT2398394.1 glycosyltransferase [Novosphingobium mangrovi (ex Huang et al. 2023)]
MKLSVLDLSFDALPEHLDRPEGYDGAFVLLRLDGRPCGQAIIWYDQYDPEAPLARQLARAANSSFWECWTTRQIGMTPAEPAPSQIPSASVAVCTRERPDDLKRCLDGLLAMTGQPSILVVDNAPKTDATRQLVAQYPSVRYVVEPKPGLDHARNTALDQAEGEIIAFTDDDAVPDPDWFSCLLRNFDDPLVMAAAGLTMALELESDAQVAFQRLGGFGRGFQRVIYDAVVVDPFDSWKAGAGVNFAVRRAATDAVGRFDPALGAGTAAHAGDETDFFRRLLAAGYKIAYDPQALNWHRHRRSMEELEQQIYAYECGSFAILTKALLFERNPRAVMRLVRWLRQQIPALVRERRRAADNGLPFSIPVAQARGASAGPAGYFRARRQARQA